MPPAIDRRHVIIGGSASVLLAAMTADMITRDARGAEFAAPPEAETRSTPQRRRNTDRPFFHVGVTVPNLRAAMTELSAAIGLSWRDPHRSRYGEWEIEVVYSIEGPPYIELVQGGADGPWSSGNGPHLDHIGIWSDDVPKDSERLRQSGIPVDFDPVSVGKPATFCYHRALASGVRIELISEAIRGRIEGR